MKEKFKGKNFISVFPVIHSGSAFNVIPDSCLLQGSLRSLEEGFSELFKLALIEILEELKTEKSIIKYDLKFIVHSKMINNYKAEAEHVERVAKEFFG